MRKVKYIGDSEVLLTGIGRLVKPGDELDVEDEFNNALFTPVEDKKKGEK